MKIRKIYMALCGILFAAQPISAQQNMLVVGNNGSVNAVAVSSVSYATFNASDKWFTFSNDGIEGATKNLITADCTVKLAADSEVKSLSVTPVVGVCYSKDNTVPTIENECLSLGSTLKSYTFTLKSLISGTTYYFRPYVKLANAVFYGDIDTAKTLGTKPVDKSKTINGHKFVDLGLPSGLLWAETNVGATSAADDGDYFSWGETVDSKSHHSWNYKYWKSHRDDGSYDFDYVIKYNGEDGKVILDKEDDAASVNWGEYCHMPTKADFEELLDSAYCIWNYTKKDNSRGYSIYGYEISSKITENAIFIPLVGINIDGNIHDYNSQGHYWSSTFSRVMETGENCVWELNLVWTQLKMEDRHPYSGRPVRPVAEP